MPERVEYIELRLHSWFRCFPDDVLRISFKPMQGKSRKNFTHLLFQPKSNKSTGKVSSASSPNIPDSTSRELTTCRVVSHLSWSRDERPFLTLVSCNTPRHNHYRLSGTPAWTESTRKPLARTAVPATNT